MGFAAGVATFALHPYVGITILVFCALIYYGAKSAAAVATPQLIGGREGASPRREKVDRNLARTYRTLKPAVVAIGASSLKGEQTVGQLGQPGQLVISGTGFCIHPDGVVITCEHVFTKYQEALGNTEFAKQLKEAQEELARSDSPHGLPFNAKQIYAIFFREEGDKWVVHANPFTQLSLRPDLDLAVGTLREPYFANPSNTFPTVTLGDSSTLEEGEPVAACGFPFGHILYQVAGSVNSSLSVGHVSALLPAPPAVRQQNFRKFQLDMATTYGNSGGPVFRPDSGEVMGIVTGGMIHPDSKVAFIPTFAIPINAAQEIVNKHLGKM